MSLYNLLCGMNVAGVALLSPFLPIRADRFPRFRDVHLGDGDSTGDIEVLTRMGGGNRECWCTEGEPLCSACEANNLEAHPSCVGRVDDDFDRTYCTFYFRVEDAHRAEFEALTAGTLPESAWYAERLKELFPDSDSVAALAQQCVPSEGS